MRRISFMASRHSVGIIAYTAITRTTRVRLKSYFRMPNTKTAVVVGAQGVIGRYIVEKLASLPDWQVIGLSRRKGVSSPRQRHVSVDLLDVEDTRQKLQ